MEGDGFPVLRRNVAGADLGSESHWICAPTLDGTAREVEQFGASTAELERAAQWMRERQVESVAIESTGVYWIAPHEVWERCGLEVVLVSTRELSQVPGRKKTDRIDCKWIQRLHSCGLLRGSFRPAERVCMLRTLVRDRGVLAAEQADWVRRMQKSLDQMNVRVHRAVSDITGVTGMTIIRAIVDGKRKPEELAALRQPGCKKSPAEFVEQLTGNWRDDYLFSLAQGLKIYDAIGERIQTYQEEILRRLGEMERADHKDQEAPSLKNSNKAKMIRQRGEEPLRQAFYRMIGGDLTSIDGVGVEVLQTFVAHYGYDLSMFPDEKKLVAHLRLAPRQPITGGKPIKNPKKRGTGSTRVAEALRQAAFSLQHSKTALGAYFRHVARRKGPDVAAFATSRKIAIYIYRMLRWGQPYVDAGAEAQEKVYEIARLSYLKTFAASLGFQLVPKAANA
jgi:transposase